jgi:hypothetical protein
VTCLLVLNCSCRWNCFLGTVLFPLNWTSELTLLNSNSLLWTGAESESGSGSELLYDWRYTANQFPLAPSPSRLTARFFFFILTSTVVVLIHLWRQDGYVIYNCCWPSPAHSCRVRVQWDPRSYFTGTGVESEFESYVTTDSQSASLSWNEAPIWGLWPHIY